MGGGSFQIIDIIFLIILVIYIFNRYKEILGSKPGNEGDDIDEKKAQMLYEMITKEVEKIEENAEFINIEELSEIDKKLIKFKNFNKEQFIIGAKRAFEIIIKSYSIGDKETLKPLLDKPILEAYLKSINERIENEFIAENDFIGFKSVEIIDAEMEDNNIAKIVVKFVSEQVNLLKDKNDKLIKGDPQFIQTIEDIWSFQRDLTSKNPNWLLVSTKKS